MGGFKRDEELGLGDVIDVRLDEGLEFAAVHLLQHAKITDI